MPTYISLPIFLHGIGRSEQRINNPEMVMAQRKVANGSRAARHCGEGKKKEIRPFLRQTRKKVGFLFGG